MKWKEILRSLFVVIHPHYDVQNYLKETSNNLPRPLNIAKKKKVYIWTSIHYRKSHHSSTSHQYTHFTLLYVLSFAFHPILNILFILISTTSSPPIASFYAHFFYHVLLSLILLSCLTLIFPFWSITVTFHLFCFSLSLFPSLYFSPFITLCMSLNPSFPAIQHIYSFSQLHV